MHPRVRDTPPEILETGHDGSVTNWLSASTSPETRASFDMEVEVCRLLFRSTDLNNKVSFITARYYEKIKKY